MKKICGLVLCLLFVGLCACGTAGTTTPETDAPETQTTSIEATTESTTGYFEMVWGWECPAGEFANYINSIYHTESGTAGSSGKAAISAVALLKFTNVVSEENEQDFAPAFASMNDAQARFFAAQWIRLSSLAREALNDPKGFHKTYDWAGLEDFDEKPYSAEKLESLNDVIAMYLLREEMQ